MKNFTARIYKIGVNPYVLLPAAVLKDLFRQAGKDKGPIPVCGTLNGNSYIQTLVKFRGKWRLYLNTPMRKEAGIDTGDMAYFRIKFDSRPRIIPMHPDLNKAFNKNRKAKEIFEKLPSYRQKEIIRYISFLKNPESVAANVQKAVRHLLGKQRFVGRD